MGKPKHPRVLADSEAKAEKKKSKPAAKSKSAKPAVAKEAV